MILYAPRDIGFFFWFFWGGKMRMNIYYDMYNLLAGTKEHDFMRGC